MKVNKVFDLSVSGDIIFIFPFITELVHRQVMELRRFRRLQPSRSKPRQSQVPLMLET